jgi:hypothetical protein
VNAARVDAKRRRYGCKAAGFHCEDIAVCKKKRYSAECKKDVKSENIYEKPEIKIIFVNGESRLPETLISSSSCNTCSCDGVGPGCG